MKRYEITIKPLSAFGTTLKGDTIFGHFCWQAAYDDTLLKDGLEKTLSRYDEKPFAVFSSAFPRVTIENKDVCLVPKPYHPLFLKPDTRVNTKKMMEIRKELKKKKWMSVSQESWLVKKDNLLYADEEIIKEVYKSMPPEKLQMLDKMSYLAFYFGFAQPHNTINRLTQTTGKDGFGPYSTENYFFFPEMVLSLFVVIDEDFTSVDCILRGLKNIGQVGFGRDASTGMGKFEVLEAKMIAPDDKAADACYALAPCVPGKEIFDRVYFSPFTRYGKHGDNLATSENPFKRPVIMADEGSVFIPKDRSSLTKPYIGTAVKNVSFIKPETVCQGYAPWLPVKLEADK